MRRFFLLAVTAAVVVPMLARAQYLGSARCRICHLQQATSWKQTKMAKAFELLKPGVAADTKRAHKLDPAKDYTHDSACLPCHTTGYGKTGGFQSIEKTPELAGVGCEMCHGAGAGYVQPSRMSLQNREFKRADLVTNGFVVANAKTCETCHNPKSPFFKAFDFETRKDQGVHQHFAMKFPH